MFQQSHRLTSLLVACLLASCSVVAVRPKQEMSDLVAAIRAAREVKADTIAPEFFREAEEWSFKARQEYRLKNFSRAKDAATRARQAAEKAEFQALLKGAARSSLGMTVEPAPEPTPEGPAPEPAPTPADPSMGTPSAPPPTSP